MLDLGQPHFGHRVAGVCLKDGRVLLHRSEMDDFWSLPGGHIQLFESSGEALRREMREELGIEIRVGRLLWVVESFFRYQGERQHELGLYCLMHLPPDSPFHQHEGPFSGDEEGLHLELRWFPCDADLLARLPVLPIFLQQALTSIPDAPQHIIAREPSFWR
jgi:8-oxo-dGTP pyrophosphatase MutT (NUDIX family)